MSSLSETLDEPAISKIIYDNLDATVEQYSQLDQGHSHEHLSIIRTSFETAIPKHFPRLSSGEQRELLRKIEGTLGRISINRELESRRRKEATTWGTVLTAATKSLPAMGW